MKNVSYHVEEKINRGWFRYSPESEKAAVTHLQKMRATYPPPKQFRLVKRTVTDEVIG